MNRRLLTKQRSRKSIVAACGSIVLAVTLANGALAVPICTTTTDRLSIVANLRDYRYWGIGGKIAPAFGSTVFNAYRSQILVFVGVLDARRNPAGGFDGCYRSDCQMQVGNIKGTIGDEFGGFYGTFGVNPYIEAYDKNGYFVRVFNDLAVGSSASLYHVRDTGIVDSAGFHLLQATFNNLQGSGYLLLGEGWYKQGSDFQITSQAEMGNFYDADQPCPNVVHQEIGTHGYGTFQNYYSNINLYDRNATAYVPWDTASFRRADFPYSDGYWRYYGARNVETMP